MKILIMISAMIAFNASAFKYDSKELIKILVAKHQNDSRTVLMSKWLIRNSKLKRVGLCYRYIKRAMVRSGYIKKYYWGAKGAKDAGAELEARGWMDISRYRYFKRPEGAILVYSGGKWGHIEKVTSIAGRKFYISDYISEKPIDQLLNRKLTGIYIYVKDKQDILRKLHKTINKEVGYNLHDEEVTL